MCPVLLLEAGLISGATSSVRRRFSCSSLGQVYKILPIHLIEMIFAVGLCFFGGESAASGQTEEQV